MTCFRRRGIIAEERVQRGPSRLRGLLCPATAGACAICPPQARFVPHPLTKEGDKLLLSPFFCRKGVRLMYITVDQLFDFTLVLLGVAGFVWLVAKAVYKKGK